MLMLKFLSSMLSREGKKQSELQAWVQLLE